MFSSQVLKFWSLELHFGLNDESNDYDINAHYPSHDTFMYSRFVRLALINDYSHNILLMMANPYSHKDNCVINQEEYYFIKIEVYATLQALKRVSDVGCQTPHLLNAEKQPKIELLNFTNFVSTIFLFITWGYKKFLQ